MAVAIFDNRVYNGTLFDPKSAKRSKTDGRFVPKERKKTMPDIRTENGKLGTGEQRLLSVAAVLFALMMVAVLGLLLFLFDDIPSTGQWNRPVDMLTHGMCLYMGVLLLALMYGVVRWTFGRINDGRQRICFLCVSAVMALVQFYFVLNYYFHTGWDADSVIQAAFQYAENGVVDDPLTAVYFSRYPHSRMPVLLYGSILRPFLRFGRETAYAALLGAQSLLGWLTGFLLWVNIRKLTKNDTLAWLGYGVYLLLGEFSPWLSIPYVDATALPLPLLLFTLWTWKPEEKRFIVLKWALMGLLSCFGCLIQPRAVFPVIAIAVIGGGLWLMGRERDAGRFLRCVLPFLAGVVLLWAGSSAVMDRAFPAQNRELAFGPAHYLLTGLSEDGLGAYSQEAADVSTSADTRAERRAADMDKLKENLCSYGVRGTLKLIAGKTIGNYGDGTFSWGIEGHFYRELLPERNGRLSPLLRSVFYSGEGAGAHFRHWFDLAQMLWMALLLSAFLAVFHERRAETAVLMLSVCMLTVFEALFESRARFFFSSLSLFILLGVLGIQAVTDEALIRSRREKPSRIKAFLTKPIPLGGRDFSNTVGLFDAAKGFFVLGMLMSHSSEPFLRLWDAKMQRSGLSLIVYLLYRPFSFLVVPLLFTICGYGFRKRRMDKIVESQLKFVWKPYVIMAAATCVGSLLLHGTAVQVSEDLKYSILPYFLGSCPRGTYLGVYVDSVGPVWFIVAYVGAGILLNLVLQTDELWLQWFLVFMMACTGVLLKDVRLPWCIQQSLVSTLFMYMGWLIKKKNFLSAEIPRYVPLLYTVFLLIVSFFGRVDVSSNSWGHGMADVLICAAGGVGALALAVRLNRFRGRWITWLRWLGRHIMRFCCVHTVFYSLIPRNRVPELFPGRPQLGSLCSFVFYTFTGVAGCWLIEKIPQLKKKKS